MIRLTAQYHIKNTKQVKSQSISLLVDFPQQPRKLIRRRRVNFAPEAKVARIINDSSNDVHSHDLWYTSKEYRQMKRTRSQDICIAIRAMQSSEFQESPSSQHLHMVGIERYLSQALLMKTKLQRGVHINAVLDEQERQDRNMIFDPESLGDLSRKHSKWSVGRAQISAQFSLMLDEV